MVVTPPFAHLLYHPRRWQSVFIATTPLVGESLQNIKRSDIPATVSLKLGQIPAIVLRSFGNTRQQKARSGRFAPAS
ncbi:MAG: hypothetical protein WB710_04565 [Stellaceae bacterium]